VSLRGEQGPRARNDLATPLAPFVAMARSSLAARALALCAMLVAAAAQQQATGLDAQQQQQQPIAGAQQQQPLVGQQAGQQQQPLAGQQQAGLGAAAPSEMMGMGMVGQQQVGQQVGQQQQQQPGMMAGFAPSPMGVFAGLEGLSGEQAASNNNDLLNYALNIAYLEASFYHMAAYGQPIAADLRGGGPAATGGRKGQYTPQARARDAARATICIAMRQRCVALCARATRLARARARTAAGCARARAKP
jgi:hypothetical protein